jgi:hypothetical protein
MTWVASAVAASAAVGLYSANKASSTQANAANQAAQISQQQYEQTRKDQAPFRAGGLASQNRLMTLLGIGGTRGGGGGTAGGGMLAGADLSGVTPDGADPFNGGLNIDANSADYGKYSRDFGMSDFTIDPGYLFRLKQGQKALDASAAARGGLISGNALKAAQGYGQEMGSQEYQNAFNRYQINRSNQLNPLQSLMGVGQSATNFVGQAGANNAAATGGYLTSGAAANAAGMVGGANAINSGLGTYLNYNQGNSLLSALRGGGGGSPYLAGPANAPVGEF